MEVGERLRLEIFYCSGHGWIPDAGLPFLVLWVWVSFGYACVSGHLPSDMALGKFLPRAESQKESPVPALPLEASGEPIASQSGCSRNSSLDRSILSRRNGPELGSRIMTSKRVYHKYQGLTGAGRELRVTEPDTHTEAPSGEAACPRWAAEASHLEFSQRVLIEYYTHGPLEDLWWAS